MIAGEEPAIPGNGILHAVAEYQLAAPRDLAGANQVRHDSIERDLAEADDDAKLAERGNFLIEEGSAGGDLVRQRFVSRRRASDHRRDVSVQQPQSVPLMS